MTRKRSTLERALETHLRALQVPEWREEYRFHPTRKWLFDFAWPNLMLAVEVEGGTWSRGRHVSGAGYAKDCEKYNAAQMAGWIVLRYTSGMVTSGEAALDVEKSIKLLTSRR